MSEASLPQRLKAWRRAQGLTQKEAAKALRIGHSTYFQCEQGNYLPRGATFKYLNLALQQFPNLRESA